MTSTVTNITRPNDDWIGILSDADATTVDATVGMIRRETFVRVFPSGRSVLTFGPVTGSTTHHANTTHQSHTTAPRSV